MAPAIVGKHNRRNPLRGDLLGRRWQSMGKGTIAANRCRNDGAVSPGVLAIEGS
jgi:hypothetical protein